MSMLKNRLLTYLIISISFSCDYQPDKEFFKYIPLTELSGVAIDLNKADTVYVFQSTELSYLAETGQKKIHSVIVYFDSKEVTRFNSAQASFYLSSLNYPDGIYSLKIEIYTSTGSNSLADILGSEQIKLTREWKAFIDRSTPKPVSITSISPNNGTLQLKWLPYNQYNFQSYMVRKYCYVPNFDFYQLCWSIELDEQNTTIFNDVTYMGGKVKYEIMVKGGFQNSEATQQAYEFVYDPELQFEWLNKQQVKFTWKKTPFYENFTGYKFGVFGLTNVVFNKETINDTTVTFEPDMKFGSTRAADLKVYSQSYDDDNAAKSKTILTFGKIIPSFYSKSIIYNKVLNKYFALQYVQQDDYKLIRIDGTTFNVEAEIPVGRSGGFSISENGEYLYVTSYTNTKRIDPNTFEVLATYDISGYSITVSDNHWISVLGQANNSLIRMSDFTIIKSSAGPQTLSPSGKFLLSNDKVLEWNGSSFIEKGSLDVTNLYYGIFKGDEKLILVYMNKIKVVDMNTMIVENEITKGDFYSQTVVYDPISDLIGRFEPIGYGDTGIYFLYALNSPTPIKTFEIGYTEISRSVYDIILNNNLLCSNGYLVPLSFFYP